MSEITMSETTGDILDLFPPGSAVDPDGELVVGGCRLADLAARYEVIAPTLPGHHGGPAYPEDQPMTFEHSTDAVERLLDELGVGTAHFVGNSMGGGIALELAKRGRARSVVALAPAVSDPEAGEMLRFAAAEMV